MSLDELLSSEEIIDIAKDERVLNDRKILNLIYGLLDAICVLLVFLPLYPYKIENFIYSVSLISQNDITSTIKLIYIITLSLLSMAGLIELLLFFIIKQKLQNLINICSFILQIISILIYAISKQPYLTSIMLVLISIKTFITLRHVLGNKKIGKSIADTKSVDKDC